MEKMILQILEASLSSIETTGNCTAKNRINKINMNKYANINTVGLHVLELTS